MNTLNLIRPELLTLSSDQLSVLTPYAIVFFGAVITLILTQFSSLPTRLLSIVLSVATLAAGIWASFCLLDHEPMILFSQMMAVDRFSHYFNILFMVTGVFTLVSSVRYLDRELLQLPEYYVLVLFSVLGMMLLASSNELIVLFISLEIMSLSIYTLVGFRRTDRRSNEAAMKYFILGGVASAFFLYGTALLYGATGSTKIPALLEYFKANGSVSPLGVIGAWTLIGGFLFKVAAAPFHMWMPDVYEGSPVPITGFMTTGLKAAVFAAFLRVLSSGFAFGKLSTPGLPLIESWGAQIHNVLYLLAILTMLVGNVLALMQSNLKRMLAYSSIAHTGYLMVGIIAATKTGDAYSGIVFYLVSYVIMNLGAFAVLTLLSEKGDTGLNLQDLSGLARKRPGLAFAMAAFVLSMAGIPPTAGFIGKYLMFYQAVQVGETPLVILAVLCSAISVYYYLRVLVYMYMREPGEQMETPNRLGSIWTTIAVAILAILTLQVGMIPSIWVESAKRAIASL